MPAACALNCKLLDPIGATERECARAPRDLHCRRWSNASSYIERMAAIAINWPDELILARRSRMHGSDHLQSPPMATVAALPLQSSLLHDLAPLFCSSHSRSEQPSDVETHRATLTPPGPRRYAGTRGLRKMTWKPSRLTLLSSFYPSPLHLPSTTLIQRLLFVDSLASRSLKSDPLAAAQHASN